MSSSLEQHIDPLEAGLSSGFAAWGLVIWADEVVVAGGVVSGPAVSTIFPLDFHKLVAMQVGLVLLDKHVAIDVVVVV